MPRYNRLLPLVAAGLLAALALPAVAQDTAMQGYEAAMDKMHEGMMAKPLSGHADVDFATQMIPHHQGAIDMAQVELQHGTDPELRAMAEKIVAAQQEEIKQLQGWLSKHRQQ